MRIGFIGAGKVATAFGRYLHERNLTIGGYYDRHPDRVTYAATVTKSTAFSDAAQLADGSDIILITTQDDHIKGVCDALCREGNITNHHFVGHMSGARIETAMQGTTININITLSTSLNQILVISLASPENHCWSRPVYLHLIFFSNPHSVPYQDNRG